MPTSVNFIKRANSVHQLSNFLTKYPRISKTKIEIVNKRNKKELELITHNIKTTKTRSSYIPYILSRYIHRSSSNAMSNGVATMAWQGAHCSRKGNCIHNL